MDANGMPPFMQNGALGRRSFTRARRGAGQGKDQASPLTFKRHACSSGSV